MSKAVELEDSEVAVELVQFAYFKKVCAAMSVKESIEFAPKHWGKGKAHISAAHMGVFWFPLQVLEKEKKRSRKDRDSGSEEEDDDEEASTQKSQRTATKR